jgi:hypothetical protein
MILALNGLINRIRACYNNVYSTYDALYAYIMFYFVLSYIDGRIS